MCSDHSDEPNVGHSLSIRRSGSPEPAQHHHVLISRLQQLLRHSLHIIVSCYKHQGKHSMEDDIKMRKRTSSHGFLPCSRNPWMSNVTGSLGSKGDRSNLLVSFVFKRWRKIKHFSDHYKDMTRKEWFTTEDSVRKYKNLQYTRIFLLILKGSETISHIDTTYGNARSTLQPPNKDRYV